MRIRAFVGVGSMLAVLAVGLSTPASASGAPTDEQQLMQLSEFTGDHRVRTRTPAPEQLERVQQLTGDRLADIAPMSEPGCVDDFQPDNADAAALDMSATGLRYCADAPPLFIMGAQTYDGWVRDQLYGFLVELDTDLDSGTGCDGAEFNVFGSWDPDYFGLVAAVIATPSCDDITWVYRGEAFIDRADSIHFIAMGWESSQIDSPRTVRYSTILTDGFSFDRAPDAGTYTLSTETAPPPPPPAKEYPTPVARDIADTCDGQQGTPFTDTPGTTHAYSINCVSGRRITSGKTATSYDPDGTLTQGQTATFLVNTLRAAGVALPEPGPTCTESDVHVPNMERLMAAGIIPPPANGICGPTATINRERMAMWTRNALAEGGVLGDASVDWYSDDDASPHTWQINEISSLGIVTGKGGALYGPTESLTRGQMATFLARSLDALSS